MNASKRISLRTSCASSVGLALLASGSAFAQAVPATGSRFATIEEVVVTAQKREENAHDVPVSISVVGDQQLQDLHVTQLTDIAAYVPGFQVDSGGSPGQTALSLRGTAPVGPGQSVGSYIDDTPVGSSSFYARGVIFALDLLPYDIERLEVLRGPQGTLYGASTIGGLLKYVTRAPDLSNFEVHAGADAFSMKDADDLGVGGRVGINAPLVEGKVAVRASYAYQRTPGYIDNPTLDREDQNEYTQDGGRVALLWKFNDAISLRLSGMWQSVDSDNNATEVFSLPPALVAVGGGRINNNVVDEPFTKDLAYYSATLNWDLGWGDFVSATSYSDTDTRQVVDGTPTYGVIFALFAGIPNGQAPFVLDLNLKKWTQEFRLTSHQGEHIEWLAGGFFTDEDSANRQTVSGQFPGGAPIPGLSMLADISIPTKYREYAVFGDFTYKFTDRFDVTVGGRWATNDQDFDQISAGGPLVPAGSAPSSSSEDVWTYMFSPRFRVSEDTMIYGRVANGYRPGGPNVPLAGAPRQVDADSLVNYEVGLKTQFLERRAFADIALFYMDWSDIQLVVVSGGVSYLSNAGSAKTQGVELSTAFMPVDGLRLGLNAAYTDAKLTEDAPAPGTGRDGDRLPRIPKWSGSLTADYSFALPNTWTARVGAGYRYVTKRLSDLQSSPDVIEADKYSALDLSASVANGGWSVRLFARNVTDEHGVLTNSVVSNALGQPQFASGTPLQPRTIGLAVDVTF